MNKANVTSRISEVGIVPVIRADSDDEARHLIDAIRAGGISIFEVTTTVPNAVSLIETLTANFGGEVIIGAGTVLDVETTRSCLSAGAKFIVSPILDLDVVETCRQADIAVFPGALTPTEIVTAWNAGADAVKIFPAYAVGGANFIKAIKAPLPEVELIPTGGITLLTVGDYIRAGAIAVGVGGELADVRALRAGQSEKITDAARAFVKAVREARSL
ncbi:MAG: bifunctional 4-hydroxy-2-oxoglutarate aldolase/2-dehydro-3-deoxy-phosphogluconate aldolase [Blastocatellia bacterium]|nr:bifunctional 4-hydroxy-2-oxoglutarate aldolase/2-dehydro-3-deoxy-phosphogluconate aldolase [Blastocatellia bacterium]